MKRRTSRADIAAFERAYRSALGRLAGERSAEKRAASGARIGARGLRLGFSTLGLARVHERAVGSGSTPPRPASKAPDAAEAREEEFFAAAMVPVEEAHTGASRARRDSERCASQLERRTTALAAARARAAQETERARQLRCELVSIRREGAAHDRTAHEMERRLKRLSHSILDAQERERMRISRDLHDAIGEALTGINVGLATLENNAASNSRNLSGAIALTQRLVARSMKSVHQFALELRPPLLDDLGLVPALRSYARAFSERTGIEVAFQSERESADLHDDGRIALFRVAQGALSNVARHARAKKAWLVLRYDEDKVQLTVRDNGQAFDVHKLAFSRSPRRLGLLVMRERMEMLGGHFSIRSSPGRGTTIEVDVPRRSR